MRFTGPRKHAHAVLSTPLSLSAFLALGRIVFRIFGIICFRCTSRSPSRDLPCTLEDACSLTCQSGTCQSGKYFAGLCTVRSTSVDHHILADRVPGLLSNTCPAQALRHRFPAPLWLW